jgi:ATP-binding cassette subfamily B (MDR/TAP) protein 1
MDAAANGGRDGKEKKAKNGRDGEDKKKEEDGDAGKKVSFTGLFRYADGTDLLLMAVGTVAAMANGMSEPLMTVVFSAVIDCFGGDDVSTVLHRVSKVLSHVLWLSLFVVVSNHDSLVRAVTLLNC